MKHWVALVSVLVSNANCVNAVFGREFDYVATR